ncbi:hypothetical protein UFOVP195_6 [uncultured Caudovirales phage]|uniref:Uncharacterized protein n=1 Tax=uncultured Caudovirales phage TaxID=2100421 RepID=A0A6J7WJ76_9CAUD|nr:hypothetical protein UFOVP195_6 [uncultured Caudovirales phage]
MPDYAFTVPQVQPVRQSSLADMLTMARGAQAYQQEQQMNPLELRAKQMQVEQAAAVNPLELARIGAESRVATRTEAPRIARAGSEAETAATGAASSALNLQAGKARIIANGYVGAINDPMILEAAAGKPVDNAKLVNYISTWAQDQAKAAGVDATTANNLIAPYIKVAQENPSGLRNFLIQRHVAGLDQSGQLGSYQTTTQVTPEGRTVKFIPGAGGTQEVTVGIAGGVSAGAAPQAGGVTAPQMAGAPLPYPIRSAAQQYIPEPSEAADAAKGQAYREGLVARQSEMTSAKRSMSEVEAKAKELEQGFLPTSGVAGAIRRKISGWAGDPTYIELSKDLANVQIGNLKALGGSMDTVAGQSLQKYANGDETYPPDVLIKIVRRNKADLTNIDMQATAAQKFKQQAGDQNMNKFKQDWSRNADSKVFEAINISKEITDPKEREKEYNKLFPNPSDRKEFLEKYRNLKKLSETGSL